MVVVPLHSQDTMGLGFNVNGNLKEGIFVSKIHKRGPTHETGLISLGKNFSSQRVETLIKGLNVLVPISITQIIYSG